MRIGIAALVLSLLAWPAFAESPDTSGAKKLGWELTLQSWTINYKKDAGPAGKTVEASIDVCKELGLHYIEIFPGQALSKTDHSGFGPGMSAKQIQETLDMAKAADVKIIDTGVIGIDSQENKARETFEWAKKMGITEIVSEPEERALPMVDKLAGEYHIKVALHDHPKPARYWDPEYTYDHIKDLKNVGYCADVGHWKRSGLEPALVLANHGDKVFSLHFKDLVPDGPNSKGWHDVPWGTGESKAAEMLSILKQKGFRGPIAIEYEYGWDMPTMHKCVDWFNEQADMLAK